MSYPVQPLTLLIDGNNLAHFLYTNLTPGQKMTPADGQRLVQHMHSYARTYAGSLRVELCLDRSPGETGLLLENLLILAAEYPQTGDDLLLDRFWFHHLTQTPCLVITNDEEIIEEVSEAGGDFMRVYDFVRRPGLVSPVFRAPDELPNAPLPAAETADHALSLSASIYYRIIKEDQAPPVSRPRKRQVARRTLIHTQPSPASRQTTHLAPVEPAPAMPGETSAPETTKADGEREIPQPQTPEVVPTEEAHYYFLTLEDWPLEEGVRFLLNAFCPRHRARYHDLMSAFDTAGLRPADLRALAELLLHACGSEPDFAQRGALMARVRLALLQARGELLSLAQLAERIGMKATGLHGRIKAKAGRWVGIL